MIKRTLVPIGIAVDIKWSGFYKKNKHQATFF